MNDLLETFGKFGAAALFLLYAVFGGYSYYQAPEGSEFGIFGLKFVKNDSRLKTAQDRGSELEASALLMKSKIEKAEKQADQSETEKQRLRKKISRQAADIEKFKRYVVLADSDLSKLTELHNAVCIEDEGTRFLFVAQCSGVMDLRTSEEREGGSPEYDGDLLAQLHEYHKSRAAIRRKVISAVYTKKK